MAIFHYTIKIVGRSKGKSVIRFRISQWGCDEKRGNQGESVITLLKKRSGLHQSYDV